MKNLILSLVLSLGAANALACSKPEAQFIGVVSEVQEQCFYKIQFTDFKSSKLCPLDKAAASEQLYYDATCSLHTGSSVSGYLIVNDGEIVVD